MVTAVADKSNQLGMSEVIDLIRSRSVRKRGSLFAHPMGKAILDSASDVQPELNPTAMSARFCISTPAEDRSEDIVNPKGLRFANYKNNPVVFFDHAMDIKTPIAKSEDPDGNLTVEIGDEVFATGYFSQSTAEGVQIYGLVEEKILRAASIDIIPIVAKARSKGSGDRPGLLIEEAEILEWSVVGLPDNPEAVRKLLDRGRIDGKPLLSSIKKSLQSMVPARPAWTPGWSPQPNLPKGDTMAKSIKKDAPDKDNLEATEINDPETDKIDKDDESGDDIAMDYDQMPYGMKVAHDVHGSLSDAAQTIKDALGPLENQDLKEHLKGLVDGIDGHAAELRDCYGKCYPGGPEMKAADPGEVEGDESGMLKHLRSSRTSALQLKGVAAAIKRLSGGKGLEKSVARELRDAADGLNRLASRAAQPVPKKTEPGPTESGVSQEQIERWNWLEKKLNDEIDRLQKLIPAGRPQA